MDFLLHSVHWLEWNSIIKFLKINFTFRTCVEFVIDAGNSSLHNSYFLFTRLRVKRIYQTLLSFLPCILPIRTFCSRWVVGLHSFILHFFQLLIQSDVSPAPARLVINSCWLLSTCSCFSSQTKITGLSSDLRILTVPSLVQTNFSIPSRLHAFAKFSSCLFLPWGAHYNI